MKVIFLNIKELDKVVEGAKDRLKKEMSPTAETEIEYLKMVRDNKRYREEK